MLYKFVPNQKQQHNSEEWILETTSDNVCMLLIFCFQDMLRLYYVIYLFYHSSSINTFCVQCLQCAILCYVNVLSQFFRRKLERKISNKNMHNVSSRFFLLPLDLFAKSLSYNNAISKLWRRHSL